MLFRTTNVNMSRFAISNGSLPTDADNQNFYVGRIEINHLVAENA